MNQSSRGYSNRNSLWLTATNNDMDLHNNQMVTEESSVKSAISWNKIAWIVILGSSNRIWKERCTLFLNKSKRQPEIVQSRWGNLATVTHRDDFSTVAHSLSLASGGREGSRNLSSRKSILINPTSYFIDNNLNLPIELGDSKKHTAWFLPIIILRSRTKGVGILFWMRKSLESQVLQTLLPVPHSHSASVFPVHWWQNANSK